MKSKFYLVFPRKHFEWMDGWKKYALFFCQPIETRSFRFIEVKCMPCDIRSEAVASSKSLTQTHLELMLSQY